MKVAELQQHLTELARLFEAAGVKQEIVADLNAMRDGLVPFRDLPLKGFADFLRRAEAYRSNGEVPLSPPKGGKKAASQPATKVVPDVQTLAQEVKQLYEQAADPSTTEAAIDGVMGRLQPLDKRGLVTIAQAIELRVPSSRTKPAIIADIRQRIIARKGSSQRVGLLDRPSPVPVNVPEPTPNNPLPAGNQSQDRVGSIP